MIDTTDAWHPPQGQPDGHAGLRDRYRGGQPAPLSRVAVPDPIRRQRRSVLIDPLAIEDLSPLGDYLVDSTVWMHGADYDMTMFKRQFGSLPAVVYDTQIGARLLGARRFGLGDLVKQYFGVELSKSSQKADWGNARSRPK